ncbi:MAG: ATP-binding cassette domain-containing protein [Burkholderiaceae bacterium]
MSLLSLMNAELAFGDTPLLDGASLYIDEREHVGLIGRNGTGKSSLLSVIAGERRLDDGEIRIADGTRIVHIEQEPELPEAADLRASLMARICEGRVLDEREHWALVARLEGSADRMGVALDRALDGLSGGERKRAALAAALALEPDLLLLDEPTNHLDIAAIEQLETVLARGPTLIVITHDRRFLDQVATRIVELDRGQLRSYPGNFAAYEKRKAEQLAEEAVQQRRFDKFWKQEEVWIRQGVQARRTRDEGRVRRLESLRLQREQRRDRMGAVNLRIDPGDASGRLVAELDHVTKSYPNPDGNGRRTVIADFSTIIRRGDRVGLIGPNGAGKTTMLKLITGAETPDSGTVRLGTRLNIAYFDQMRAQLDPDRTVVETISPGSEWIDTGTIRKHVMTYLADFLFSPRRANSPVSSLSGGERNRLLLARLFAQPGNLLVLDEPTNDLDIESLDILESTLQEYTGTLLLVSHDRAFLDAVVTQVIGTDGDGRWRSTVGGYSDWQREQKSRGQAALDATAARGTAAPRGEPAQASAPGRIKLTYKETRELDAMPDRIASLEAEQSELHARMADPAYYREPADKQRLDNARVQEIESALLQALERWESLEAKSQGR